MEVGMGIFIALIIASVVISQIVSASKKAKKSENSAIITKPKAPVKENDGVFGEFETAEQKAVRLNANGMPPKGSAITKARVQKSVAPPPEPVKSDPKPYVPIQAQIKSHIHGTLEEKNIPVENSMGEKAAKQGCSEHYYSRFLEEDDAYDIVEKKKVKLDGALKAMIIGEVLNDPAFKRRGGVRKTRR